MLFSLEERGRGFEVSFCPLRDQGLNNFFLSSLESLDQIHVHEHPPEPLGLCSIKPT